MRQWWRRRARWQRVSLYALAAIGALVAALAIHTTARLEGWLATRAAPNALSAMLSPNYELYRPEGDGPFPTALLFHGCDGPQDNLERWARALVAAGWAALTVDSFTPRDLADGEAWRLVCAGQQLPGGERAGDVMVAIADASVMPFVDPDRLALIGLSHGGWSIMELLALRTRGDLPLNLSALPPALAERGLSGVRASILVYPWCGLANRGRRRGWTHDAPTLFILATRDIIAPIGDCLEAVARLEERDQPVATFIIEGATHGFDQEQKSALSPLVYDPEATEAALARAMDFLASAISTQDER